MPESLSRYVDAVLPAAMQQDPEEHAHARTTVAGLYAAAPFVFFLAVEQHLSYGLWSVTLPVGLAGVGFLTVPWLFRVLPPQRVRDVMALVIYLTIFAVGAARGGLHLSIVTWNLVLIFGAGLFSQTPMTVVWGALILLQVVVLFVLGQSERLPYVASTALQQAFSFGSLLVWSVVMSVLVDRARQRRDRERRALAEQVDVLRRIEALGRLSGGIAHDFNNLLTVVSAHARLLADELQDAGHLEDLDAIEQAARRGRDFTARLLAMTRGEREERELVDLAASLRDFARFVRLAISESVELELQLEEGAMAWVEPAALEQVLLNACLNASDAMPAGGRLRLVLGVEDVRTPRAGVHGNVAPGRWVRIAVEDDGVGMPPEVVERMFEAFYSTKSRADGSGIGLASAVATVRRLDGQLMVDSEPGRGTTFAVYLPARSREDTPDRVDERRPGRVYGASSGLSVLLADDEPGVRRVLRRVLEREGMRVTEVSDGVEALAAFEDGSFDLVVTDVVMPGMTGVELYEAIVSEAPEQAFVFVSGYADASDRVKLASAQSVFVEKPFTHAAVLQAIGEALSTREEASAEP